jgi:hypothetical protein
VILERLNAAVGHGDDRITALPGALLVRLVRGRLLGEEVSQALLLVSMDLAFPITLFKPRNGVYFFASGP